MAKDYETLLKELGGMLNVELEPGEQDSCTLFFNDKEWRVNIDMMQNNRDVLISVNIKDISPGKYRELLLKQAMIFNAKEGNKFRLAYSDPQNSLVLFTIVPMRRITAAMAREMIGELREVAEVWREAMNRGVTPDLTPQESKAPGSSGMFGL